MGDKSDSERSPAESLRTAPWGKVHPIERRRPGRDVGIARWRPC